MLLNMVLKKKFETKKLSTDKTKIIEVLKYELIKESKYNNYKYVVLVQPTSPTVTTNLIDKAIIKH